MKAAVRFGWALAAALTTACAAGGTGTRETAPEPARAGAAHAARGVIVIGAILPRTGSEYLERYGELVLQGLELAVQEYEERYPGRIRLEVVDDRGDPEGASLAMDRLERSGAVAVIGPLLPQSIAVGARARKDGAPAIVAPLASESPGEANVYALNATDVHGARLLARYAAAAGLERVAVLYPRSPEYRRQAYAFMAELKDAGGVVVAEVPYDSGTTTFASQLRSIAAAEPEALFVPAPERDVHQIAPQITYYGVAGAGVKVLGGEAWTTPTVVNQVAARYLDGVVAVTPLLRSGPESGWSAFVERYENTHRRSLDNPFPALGYDALRLVLAAIEHAGKDDAKAVARGLSSVRDLRGATGILSVEGGAVVRRPYLVRIERGELVPVPAPAGGAPSP